MITSITLWRYTIPLMSPLVLKVHTLTQRQGLILQWHHSGGSEWSEIAPLPGFSKESLDESEKQLIQFLDTHLIQLKSINSLQSLNALINNTLYPSVRFGLEMGLIKLTQFKTINTRYSATTLNHTSAIAGLITGDVLDITRYSDYPTIKVKVGREILDNDINNINKILQLTDNKQTLRLDANQSWTLDQATRFFTNVPAERIEFIEEPLKVSATNDFENYKNWSTSINTSFALDEQVQNPDFKLIPIQGLSTIVIKPMLIGLKRTLEMVDKIKDLGINIVISSSYESSLTLNFLYQLSAQLPNTLPPGLDTFSSFEYDLIEPLSLPCKREPSPLLLPQNLERIKCYAS
jgi:O-succinylbenzoate synthase